MNSTIQGYVNSIKEGRLSRMKSEIKWIYGYGRSHVLSIIIYTALGLSSAVVGLFSSLVSKDLVDIITGQNTGELLKTFITIIAATVFGAVISQFSIYFSSKITLKRSEERR